MSEIDKPNQTLSASSHLFAEIRELLVTARRTAYKAVNFAMVTAYWNVGRLIVEDEQQAIHEQKMVRLYWRIYQHA